MLYNVFSFVSGEENKLARFSTWYNIDTAIPVKPFQPDIFASKTSAVFQELPSRVGFWTNLPVLDKPARDQRSTLFGLFNSN